MSWQPCLLPSSASNTPTHSVCPLFSLLLSLYFNIVIVRLLTAMIISWTIPGGLIVKGSCKHTQHVLHWMWAYKPNLIQAAASWQQKRMEAQVIHNSKGYIAYLEQRGCTTLRLMFQEWRCNSSLVLIPLRATTTGLVSGCGIVQLTFRSIYNCFQLKTFLKLSVKGHVSKKLDQQGKLLSYRSSVYSCVFNYLSPNLIVEPNGMFWSASRSIFEIYTLSMKTNLIPQQNPHMLLISSTSKKRLIQTAKKPCFQRSVTSSNACIPSLVWACTIADVHITHGQFCLGYDGQGIHHAWSQSAYATGPKPTLACTLVVMRAIKHNLIAGYVMKGNLPDHTWAKHRTQQLTAGDKWVSRRRFALLTKGI